MPAISKLLVANRGEIACRVLASARARGYRTVAIYSEADRDALHVRLADEAVLVGPAPVGQSYLDIERVIGAARLSGADAIHPGYGFLSERAAFAEACAAAGIIFVGPTPNAIRIMGDKAESKLRMIEAGVPTVPGYHGADQSEAVFIREAARIGFPVMVKASAGGGGRGMRLVHDPDELVAALRSAASEARNAFGDGRLLLERAVVSARHVEIQVFGDAHGQVIHLGERDCSVQRRHQKVVEEAPSPAVDADLRARMGEAAVAAAAAIGYVGAGTVEFLLAEDGAFYFLEMNTRLQVEHPVTEMVTGLDLVSLQLDVAEGKPLPLCQDDVRLTGHAIEVRLYAEDPAANFLPQTGEVTAWEPADGEGVRIDHGLRVGTNVSSFYDPMLAKLIAWGADRDEARRRLLRAVEDTRIFGVATNRAFLAELLRDPLFAAGAATTEFIGQRFPGGFAPPPPPAWAAPLAAVLIAAGPEPVGWQNNTWTSNPVRLRLDEVESEWLASRQRGGWVVSSGEHSLALEIVERGPSQVRFAVDGFVRQVGAREHAVQEGGIDMDVGGVQLRFFDRTFAPPAPADSGGGSGVLRAPMSGAVLSVQALEGARVSRGELLLVLEAMKMEHQIVAPIEGVIEQVAVRQGDQVASRDTLVVIRPELAA